MNADTTMIRPALDTDAVNLYAILSANRKHFENLPWVAKCTLKDVGEHLKRTDIMLRVITVDGGPVGVVSLTPSTTGGQHVIGYWLDPAVRGKGVMKRAVKMFLAIAWHKDIIANIRTQNRASMHILVTNGFWVRYSDNEWTQLDYGRRPGLTYRGRDIEFDEAVQYIEKGWHGLVLTAFLRMFEAGWDGEIRQVKEKFGALRIYIGAATDEVRDIVAEAEGQSMSICEYCGDPGELRCDLGWDKTLCDGHHSAELEKRVHRDLAYKNPELVKRGMKITYKDGVYGVTWSDGNE